MFSLVSRKFLAMRNIALYSVPRVSFRKAIGNILRFWKLSYEAHISWQILMKSIKSSESVNKTKMVTNHFGWLGSLRGYSEHRLWWLGKSVSSIMEFFQLRVCQNLTYLFHKKILHIATISFMPLRQSSGYWYKEKWNHNSCFEIN